MKMTNIFISQIKTIVERMIFYLAAKVTKERRSELMQ